MELVRGSCHVLQEKMRLSDELKELDLQLKQMPASTHTMKAMLEAKVSHDPQVKVTQSAVCRL